MVKLVPPVLFLICLGLMALLRWLWPVRIISPFPYNLFGIVPILAGLLFTLLGVRQFRKSRANIKPFQQPEVFVTEGPYRYSRNPMYAAVLLVLVGAWILFGAITCVLGVFIFMIVADQWYIPFEERMLHQKFGQAFEAYCARTRRWI